MHTEFGTRDTSRVPVKVCTVTVMGTELGRGKFIVPEKAIQVLDRMLKSASLIVIPDKGTPSPPF